MSAHDAQRRAASSLSHPAERGTLSYAYRRSVVALQSAFGFGSQDGQERPEARAEREPLLTTTAAASSSSAPAPAAGYGSIQQQQQQQQQGDVPPEARVRKPKVIKGPVRVEAKVWFANERTWISWLRVSVLIGSFALALLNSASFFEDHNKKHHHPPLPGSPDPSTIRTFGLAYAAIAVATLVWGLANYQRRVTLIKNKFGGAFDDLIGPPIVCVALFVAVLVNFVYRVRQWNDAQQDRDDDGAAATAAATAAEAGRQGVRWLRAVVHAAP